MTTSTLITLTTLDPHAYSTLSLSYLDLYLAYSLLIPSNLAILAYSILIPSNLAKRFYTYSLEPRQLGFRPITPAMGLAPLVPSSKSS